MGVSGFARFSASLARVRFGASAPFGARADNGTAARRAAASAASAGAWKPHGRRADAGREETLEPRSGETLSSETARFCFDPLVAGLAMARRYPGGSREDRPRGGAARTVARLRHVWSRGEGEARLDADPSRSASSRATRFAFAASSASARVRATASRAATRRAEPSEEDGERRAARPVPVPAVPGDGDGDARDARDKADSFSDSFSLLREASARRSSSAATASRSSATRRSVVSRRCVRACFTRSSACFVVKGDREAARSAVGGDSGAAIGGSAIVSSERRTGAGTSLRYDSANVSSDASNEPSSSSPGAREVTRTALDAAGERTGFGFGAAAADAAAAAARTASLFLAAAASIARARFRLLRFALGARSRRRLPTLPPRSERRRASLDAASRFRRRRQRVTTRARPSSASRRAQRVAPPPGTPKPRAPPRRARRKTAPPLPPRRPKAPRFLRARKTTPPSQEPAWGDPRAPEAAEPRPCLLTPRCRKSAALPPAAAETSQPPRPRTRPPSLPLFSKMRAAPPPGTPRPGSRTASGPPRRRARLAKAPGVFRRVPVLRPRPTRRPHHPPPPRE